MEETKGTKNSIKYMGDKCIVASSIALNTKSIQRAQRYTSSKEEKEKGETLKTLISLASKNIHH